MKMDDIQVTISSEKGKKGHINDNCWLVKTLRYSPLRRCFYCNLKFSSCPFFQYSIISLILIFFSIFLSFFLEGKILKLAVIPIFSAILIYGYFFNKSTEKIIETSFAQKQAKETAEEARTTLEMKVGEKTKELEGLSKGLEFKVKERTTELENSREALLNILEDVDEARHLALEERDKTLAIIRNFSDGLLVFNKEGKLLLINPQAEIFFGMEGRNIVDKSVLELNKFQILRPLMTLLGREIKVIFREEIVLKENLVLEVSTVPMIAGGEKTGTLVILHDVTREKLIERMKTEFVSLSAHQLRTPLSAIKWSLKMLLEGDIGKINREQKDFVEKTYKANERMINLVNDLLDVTRIEEGRYLFKLESLSLEGIVESVIDTLKEGITRKRIDFYFEKSKKGLPKVKVDKEKISLVVQNLLENAIAYTPPGGKVVASLKPFKNGIEFSVKDTGIGIPRDQHERVFTKFFRGSNAVRTETEGTGLGLFITKNIIEAHKGKIWFESEEGKGTTLHFALPA